MDKYALKKFRHEQKRATRRKNLRLQASREKLAIKKSRARFRLNENSLTNKERNYKITEGFN